MIRKEENSDDEIENNKIDILEFDEHKEMSIDMSLDVDGKMMEDENDEVIDITYKTYLKYFNTYWNGPIFFLSGNLAMVGFMVCSLAQDYLIGDWALKPN